MLSKSSKRPQLTHFLCVPLVTAASRPLLETSLHNFKTNFNSCRPHSLEGTKLGVKVEAEWSRAVRPVGTLHLTLGVMSLLNRNSIDRAISVLHTLDVDGLLRKVSQTEDQVSQVPFNTKSSLPDSSTKFDSVPSKHTPITISLLSLRPMHKPNSTSILYAMADDTTNRLSALCEELRKIFIVEGLLIDENRPLKLHATVANTVYTNLQPRKGPGGNTTGIGTLDKNTPGEQHNAQLLEGTAVKDTQEVSSRSLPSKIKHKRFRKKPIHFDARELLDRYKDFEWVAEFSLDRIAICEMGAKQIQNEDGEVIDEAYKEVAATRLPLE